MRAVAVTIIQQGDRFELIQHGEHLGRVSAGRDEFHSRNIYLELDLMRYEPAGALELFATLRNALGAPLQVMQSSEDREAEAYLRAGGFRLARRCFEMTVREKDMLPGEYAPVELYFARKGEAEYEKLCERLYFRYAATHSPISPLTASLEKFCEAVPPTAVCSGDGRHFAFVQGDEIAYFGGEAEGFTDFAATLARRMFSRYDSIFFECDDCDELAMTLRGLFRQDEDESWDTYVLG